MPHEFYDDHEVTQILGRAAELEGRPQLDMEMLERTGRELGISPEAVRRAEAEYRRTRADSRLKEEFVQGRRADFRTHLASYLVINVFLHLINFFTSRGDSDPSYWAIFPLLGWGIAIALHAFSVRLKQGREFDQEFSKWKAEREKASPSVE